MLETNNSNDIRLVNPNLGHATDIFAYSKLPIFHEFLESSPMQEIKESETFLANLIEQNRRGERDYFVIELNGKLLVPLVLFITVPYTKRQH